jgi:endonuclease/exonuclease/phosphatase family metal-dependent hydrolase
VINRNEITNSLHLEDVIVPIRPLVFWTLTVLLSASLAGATLAPITLDGEFDDWASLTPVLDDSGDNGGTVDFGRVWVANDQDYLYFRFETGGEVQSDEQQNMRLYLDTDMNSGTGISLNGIGADLMWEFGWREGTFRSSTTVEHSEIGLMMGPTVSNTEFEVALRRDAIPDGSNALFPGSTVRFVLRDTDSGDLAPNSGSVTYTFTAGTELVPSLSLDRYQPDHIRLVTWNIQSDGLFDGGTTESAQNRMLDAMDPDILIVNEVWYHNAGEVVAQIEQLLPSGAGENWYGVMRDSGNVIVSRYPILQSWEVNPGYRITAALLDMGPSEDKDLLVIACHWRCCTADANRQEEADSVIGFMRDAKTPGGVITLPLDTPIILGGDLNLVGWRQQLDTLITGDIQDEGTYGVDAAPDWDGGNFTYPPTRHPDARTAYTWRNDFSSYYPGLLDWICYTASVMEVHNHYILETRTMTPTNLATNGLSVFDTSYASDHAPRVVDFTMGAIVSSTPPVPASSATLLPNVPNPFNPSTRIAFELDRQGDVELKIYNARGKLVRDLTAESFDSGVHEVVWNGTSDSGFPAPSSVYYVRLTVRNSNGVSESTRKISLIE